MQSLSRTNLNTDYAGYIWTPAQMANFITESRVIGSIVKSWLRKA
ncbi:hypothetical protein [Dyadobacter sp. 3J3]|nr:hypothetical protein [Dyadobacter sp. 3J3]